jgi:hypothetical protein
MASKRGNPTQQKPEMDDVAYSSKMGSAEDKKRHALGAKLKKAGKKGGY